MKRFDDEERRKESVESVHVSLPGSNTVHQSVIKDARRVCRSRYTGSKIIYYIIRDISSVYTGYNKMYKM